MFETRRYQNQGVGVENVGKVRVGVGHFTSDSATLMKTLDVHEDLVGLYETRNTKAETTTKLNKVSVCRLGLDLNDCSGQEYNGASNTGVTNVVPAGTRSPARTK